MRLLFLFASLLLAAITVAQTQKASGVADLLSVDTPIFVLEHVRVIDGTGTPAQEDQAVVIANGKIQFIGPEESAQIPPGAKRMGRSGYTVIPGLVGMHNHLYYADSYTVQVVDGKVGLHGAATLSGGWGDHNAYDRKPGALHRLESREPDRRKPDAGTQH
jgi:imidazolonepropionase-like amidohydrolase